MSSATTLCPLPFQHLFINNRGYVQPCCLSYPQYKSQTTEMREQDVNVVGISQAVRAASLQIIREKMLAGQWPGECGTCRRTESEGNLSRRTEELNAAKEFDPQKLSIKSMDLRLGNVCNLMCRMCSPFSSAALLPEWKKSDHMLMQKSTQIYMKEKWLNWSENPELWQELIALSADVTHINFAGGEPFLNKQHVPFLKSLIANGRARSIQISYNTNLSVVPDYLVELLTHFKSVHLIVSVDGVGKLNEYIRHPLNWPHFEENIKTLTKLQGTFSDTLVVSFNVTVQMYNVFSLGAVVAQLLEYRRNGLKSVMHSNFLFNPDYFDCANLPKKAKASAIEKLQKTVNSLPFASSCEDVTGFVRSVEKHLQEHGRPEKLVEFYEVTDFFDRSRNQNLHELVPELKLK